MFRRDSWITSSAWYASASTNLPMSQRESKSYAARGIDRLALCLTTVSAERARERNQIGDAGCEQQHGQRQGERRKVRRGRPADGVEHQISSSKELKKE